MSSSSPGNSTGTSASSSPGISRPGSGEEPRLHAARSASGSRGSSAPASRTSSRCCRTCCGTGRTPTTARASRPSSSSRARSRTPCSSATSSGPSPRNTDVILFNIDSKADHRTGRDDLILRVFLKVLNEMQGYSGDHPHIAHMERYLEAKGKLEAFQAAYGKSTGLELGQGAGRLPVQPG